MTASGNAGIVPAASLRAVSYRYPDEEAFALTGIDLDLLPARIHGVVGADGAGKSTLARLLAGFIPHLEAGELTGQAEVAGHVVARTPLARLVEDVGLVTANPFHQISGTRYTVREEIAFGLENLAVPRAEMIGRIAEVSRIFGLDELLDRSPYEISMGQQQLVIIASMTAMRPRLLVLDEPTSSLDPASSRLVFEALRRIAATGACVVVLGNDAELLAEYASAIVVLVRGRIAARGPAHQVLGDVRLPDWGIEPTRFTRLARTIGIADGVHPPVTLADAVRFFGER